MAKILLIEDDSGIILPLSLYIQKEWHELITAEDGESAIDIFQQGRFDLVILDINLPKKSGIDVCRDIRKQSSTPIIVLSARNNEQDKLLLFELWVDDYVAKPFSSRELMARIAAVMKRVEAQKKPKNGKSLEFGCLTLYPKQHTATCDHEAVSFTKTEFAILEYCIKNANGIIKREGIMQDVMGYENYLYDRTIDTHIKNIRKKLAGKIHIETIRGIGYRFEII